MSVKKRSGKDKSPSVEVLTPSLDVAQERDWLLAERPSLLPAISSPFHSLTMNYSCGVPPGALVPLPWPEKREVWLNSVEPGEGVSRRERFSQWAADVASRLPSSASHPYHTVHVQTHASTTSGTASGHSVSETAHHVAGWIRRLVTAHTTLANACCASSDSPYTPETDVERLLGYNVYGSSGYVGPEKEQKNSTFKQDHSLVDHQAQPRLCVVTHRNATHVNVCCGLWYYQLVILDADTGKLFEEVEIASGLQAIYTHAQKKRTELANLDLSEEDKTQLQDTEALLARITSVEDDSAADLHRRLREASDVNSFSLDQLERGLFTVVLVTDDFASDAKELLQTRLGDYSGSQWLRSCMSLYCRWPAAGDVASDSRREEHIAVIRANALITSLSAVIALAAHSAQTSAQSSLPSRTPSLANKTAARPGSSADAVDDRTAAIATAAAATACKSPRADGGTSCLVDTTLCSGLGDDSAAAHLSLWLPQQHRAALTQPPPAVRVPHWESVALSESNVAAADLCLTVVLGADRALQRRRTVGGASGDVPRVVVSLLPPHRTAPVSVSLVSPEVEQCVRVHRSNSALMTRSLRRRAHAAARSSVAAILRQCMFAAVACSEAANSTPPDVAITLAVLSRAGDQRHCRTAAPETEFRACRSGLGTPASVLVLACVVQQRAEKELTLSECVVSGDIAVGGSEEKHAALAMDVGAAMKEEILLV